MAFETSELQASDVKCYFCGHVSGQIVTRRGDMSGAARFVPRPGYTGGVPGAGRKLRCERCRGPVFLEDAGQVEPPRTAERPQRREVAKAA